LAAALPPLPPPRRAASSDAGQKPPSKPPLPAEWISLAKKELGERSVDSLIWRTAEGLDVKPLYTATDLPEEMKATQLPAVFPYTRGVYATMYTVKPWTVRQVGCALGGERRLRSASG
jgi:methylmalonyl-CoA mutase N-terminal domain/subunit